MAAPPDYSAIVPELESVIRQEMSEWGIGGMVIALVDGSRTVHTAGYGEARADSLFRAGSISKLFTALAVMQEVEAGRLDLDAPLPPEVSPVNPFPGQPAITLRQILSHRSGFQREPATGHYFDPSGPGTAATALSVSSCVLATPPEAKTRYSNAAPTVAGYLAAKSAGKTFEALQQERLLTPLGMKDSGWTLASIDRSRLMVSHMRVADGRGGWHRREAPVFDLGTIPAGNLFTTAGDLAGFASALLADGGGLVRPATLREMWRPQFTEADTGFGLGFVVGKFGKHRSIGHNGAVYGHSAFFTVLPEAGIGVVLNANEDIVNGRTRRIGELALSLMLKARLGEIPPPVPAGPAPSPQEAAAFTGDYESASAWARLEVRDGRLTGEISGQPLILRPAGSLTFTGHSRLEEGVPVRFEKAADGQVTGFSFGPAQFVRVPAGRPSLPAAWRRLAGRYGPDFIPVIVSERHGRLYAMTENMTDYRLTPENRLSFALCPGMYTDERVTFLTSPDGSVHGMDFASMIFVRRP